jgi:phosphoglycolate phosphatase
VTDSLSLPGTQATPRTLGLRGLRAVLFDLDGTLLDTAGDIAEALNRALIEQGLPKLAETQVRALIGRGVASLIERAIALLGAAGASADAARLLDRYEAHYASLRECGANATRAYPGVRAGLSELRARNLRMAVVTNKPRRATLELLERLELQHWIDVVIGGDAGGPRKPHPQPLLSACAALGVYPDEALMVGDSAIDVTAARAAQMPVVCVLYGYNEGADPRSLPCDAHIASLAELPALLPVGVTLTRTI